MTVSLELDELNCYAKSSISGCVWSIWCKARGEVYDDGEACYVEDLELYDVVIYPKSFDDKHEDPPYIRYNRFDSIYCMFVKEDLDKMKEKAEENLIDLYAHDNWRDCPHDGYSAYN